VPLARPETRHVCHKHVVHGRSVLQPAATGSSAPMIRRRAWLLPVVILLLAAGLRVVDPLAIQRIRLAVLDEFQRQAPRAYVDTPVRIVDIDDRSLELLGQWPWPRTRIAALVDRLGELGAAVVAFDVLFAEPDRTSPARMLPEWRRSTEAGVAAELAHIAARLPDHDRVLAAAVANTPTVLGMMLIDDAGAVRRPRVDWAVAVAGDDPRPFLTTFPGAVPNLPGLEAAAAGQGSFNSSVDPDGIIRRLPAFFRLAGGGSAADEIYPSLAAEALRVAQGATTYVLRASGASGNTAFGESTGLSSVRIGAIEVPTDARGHIWLHDTGHVPARFISAWQIFENDFDAGQVAGRIVLIGTGAAGLRDIRATPLSAAIAGVEIHAQALEQMILGSHLVRPDWISGAEIAWLLALGTVLAVLIPRWGALWCAPVAGGGITLAIAASWFAYVELGWLVDPVYPSVVALLLYLTQSFVLFLHTEADRRQVRGAFGRYLSPTLVERLAQDPSLLRLGGEIREMTILFADIRGFTAISETMDAEALTRFINAYLTPMTDVILASAGTIDKYMGDAIMAFWNAPLDDPDHAAHAARAALAMLDRLEALNGEWRIAAAAQGREHPGIAIGIGLNTGPCCVGNMGSDQRFDYSVLGDTANVASRLESQSKTYGVAIVAGEATAAATPALAWLELDLIRVLGKARPVRVHALLGDEAVAAEPWFAATRDAQAIFLGAYRRRDWPAALAGLGRLRGLAGGRLDRLAALYARRIDTLSTSALRSDWDGVFMATEK
jgi:adenylate cyclase